MQLCSFFTYWHTYSVQLLMCRQKQTEIHKAGNQQTDDWGFFKTKNDSKNLLIIFTILKPQIYYFSNL